MKNIILLPLFLAFTATAAPAAAQNCFASKQQKYEYEQGLAPAQQNAQITACLQAALNPDDFEAFDAAAAALRKSGNTAAATGDIMKIFRETKSPQAAFSAAAFLISAPAGQLQPYEKTLYTLLASGAPDYKKTLAVAMLAAMGADAAGYTPFLTPAIEASDPVLQAYAAAAYTVLSPQAQGLYLDKIIFLYGFDKNFAQAAFAATGLKEKALHAALKTALKNARGAGRVSAIEWIADAGDKKLLEAALEANYDTDNTTARPAAAQALGSNFEIMESALKKALKKAPASSAAATAVMAYSLIGGNALGDIETALKSGDNNEISNALRVVAAVAGILAGEPSSYPNPGLERQKLQKLIPMCARIDNEAKNTQVKTYAAAAVKELYKLLNAPAARA
ncbi:MAG: hypothetical protein LBL61_00555 [Elusimicrobiota bacterium]|jgi:hypothetical protein|nr:hypothetical protein [Elusimicrobiota bacterium]